MKRVLIAEDEAAIREFVVINLKRGGYEVVEAEDGAAALALYDALGGDIDVAVLDVMMPNMDGLEACERLRARNSNIGIIMLTAKAQETDKITGLMRGADDYITKPFSPMELVARVDAILRRAHVTNEETLEAGGIVIDKKAHTVTVDGEPIELSFKEYELLQYFIENQGIALSREKILNNVWNYDYFGEVRTIDTHVKKLRSKLGDKENYIHTIWGIGYKFEVE